jgi:hypothetical protein
MKDFCWSGQLFEHLGFRVSGDDEVCFTENDIFYIRATHDWMQFAIKKEFDRWSNSVFAEIKEDDLPVTVEELSEILYKIRKQYKDSYYISAS